MSKHTVMNSALTSVVLCILTGCASINGPSFDTKALPQPRPLTAQESRAATILYDRMPQYKISSLELAVDTAAWEDEPEVLGGFNPMEVLSDTYLVSSERRLKDNVKALIRTYGTVPRQFRNDFVIHSDQSGTGVGGAVVTSFAFSGAVGNSGAFTAGSSGLSPFGIVMGLGSLLSSPSSWERDFARRLYLQPGLVYVTTGEETKQLNAVAEKTGTMGLYQFVIGKIVKVFSEVLKEKGFTPIEAPEYGSWKDQVAYAVQPYGNEALGCPMQKQSKRSENCRLDIGFSIEDVRTDEENGRLLFGVQDYYMIHDGWFRGTGIFVKTAKVEDVVESINRDLWHELPKRDPHFTVYWPARPDENGKMIPQHVIDKDGEHYFVVRVKRTPEAQTTAELKD